MPAWIVVLTLFSAVLFASDAWAERLASDLIANEVLDQSLAGAFDAATPDEPMSVIVFLHDQANIGALNAQLAARRAGRIERRREVTSGLRSIAEATQAPLLRRLEALRAEGRVERFDSFWIANAVRVDASKAVIQEISERQDVLRIYPNLPIQGIQPVVVADGEQPQSDLRSSPEPGVLAVRAPEVWGALGITGQGVLVGSLDSGVAGHHPALAGRWRGLDPAYADNPEWAWFDPVTKTTFPEEFGANNHGTHVMGTMVGGAPGDSIGIAPGAEWINAAVVDRVSLEQSIADIIIAFEWITAPTGDPDDSFAAPHVVNHSWGIPPTITTFPTCDDLFWSFIDNSESAGTVHIFAAGNTGALGLGNPGNRASDAYRNTAVGAIDPHDPTWPLTVFSSTGPSYCAPGGAPAVKPDLVAPGLQIRSAGSGGGYFLTSGTSMAAPHVSGVVALMFEGCPDLTPDQIKQILFDAAVDLGAPGKDNSYGWGMVDAYEAVLNAFDVEGACRIGISFPQGLPESLDPGIPISIPVNIIQTRESVVPGSAVLMHRATGHEGAFTESPLTHVGGELYEIDFPALNCGEGIEYYVRVEGDGGTIRTNPLLAPDSLYVAPAGDLEDVVVLQESFGAGLPEGWSMSGLWSVSDSCSVAGDCHGPIWAYYGQSDACNYVTGTEPNSGELRSAPIQIPDVALGQSAIVRFCHNLQTEGDPSNYYDRALFGVVGGKEVQLLDTEGWTTHIVDITEFAGQTVTLRWRFDTIDGQLNDYRGWQIDQIRIEAVTLGCAEPGCPADLDGDGAVGSSDLAILLGSWGPAVGSPSDLTGDGLVGSADLAIVLGNWGPCPE